MRTLVLWYSRTGNTAAVADEIVRLTGWDHDELVDRRGPRHGLVGYLRSVVEARLGLSVPLEPPGKDPAAYDLVVVGTPTWAGRAASPVATYLRVHAAALRRVAFFITHDGAMAHEALAHLEHLCGRAPDSRLIVREEDVESGDFRVGARGFVEILREPRTRRRRAS
jgi:hypothetical protein